MELFCDGVNALKQKPIDLKRLFRWTGIASFAMAGLMIAWAIISRIHFFEDRYAVYIQFLSDLETRIASIRNYGIVILVILLLYFVKAALPLYPISILCVASAMVFRVPESLLLNLIGLALMFSTRYFLGENDGSPARDRLARAPLLDGILQSDSRSSPWLLLAVRMLPGIPLNTVSQIYGAMRFPYWEFILISEAGSLPKLLLYILIGRNVSNPFTLRFSIPLTALLIVTGAVFLTMSMVWDQVKQKRYRRLAAPGGEDEPQQTPGADEAAADPAETDAKTHEDNDNAIKEISES